MEDYLDKRKGVAKYGPLKWREIEEDRRRKAVLLDFFDKKRKPFWFVLSLDLLNLISEIERNRDFLSSLKLPKKVLDRLASDQQKREADYSSHIEGAVTSLEAALLHLNKPSRKDYGDESLQMIVNNRDALEYLRRQSAKPFNDEMN